MDPMAIDDDGHMSMPVHIFGYEDTETPLDRLQTHDKVCMAVFPRALHIMPNFVPAHFLRKKINPQQK